MNFLFARKKSGEAGASDVRDEFEKLCRRLILLLSKCSASVFSLRESRREKRLLKNIRPEDENLIFFTFRAAAVAFIFIFHGYFFENQRRTEILEKCKQRKREITCIREIITKTGHLARKGVDMRRHVLQITTVFLTLNKEWDATPCTLLSEIAGKAGGLKSQLDYAFRQMTRETIGKLLYLLNYRIIL
jgi:hypothetical protein